MFRFTVTVPVDFNELDSETMTAALGAATNGVRLRCRPSVSRPLGEGSGPGTAYFELLADDELALREALDRVVTVLRIRGVHVAGEPAIIAARPYDDEAASAIPGIGYTRATHTLTVQTWAPDQHDLEITFDPVPGGGGLVMATVTSPDPDHGSVSETFPVEILRIDRPAAAAEKT